MLYHFSANDYANSKKVILFFARQNELIYFFTVNKYVYIVWMWHQYICEQWVVRKKRVYHTRQFKVMAFQSYRFNTPIGVIMSAVSYYTLFICSIRLCARFFSVFVFLFFLFRFVFSSSFALNWWHPPRSTNKENGVVSLFYSFEFRNIQMNVKSAILPMTKSNIMVLIHSHKYISNNEYVVFAFVIQTSESNECQLTITSFFSF